MAPPPPPSWHFGMIRALQRRVDILEKQCRSQRHLVLDEAIPPLFPRPPGIFLTEHHPHAPVYVPPREKPVKKVNFDDDGDHYMASTVGSLQTYVSEEIDEKVRLIRDALCDLKGDLKSVKDDERNDGNTSDDENLLVEQMEQQMDSQSYQDYIKFLEGSDDEVENFDDLCANLAKVKIRWYTKELSLLNDIVDGEPDAASEASSSDYWLSRDILLKKGYDLNAESDEALDELFDHVRLEPEFLARKRAKDEEIS